MYRHNFFTKSLNTIIIVIIIACMFSLSAYATNVTKQDVESDSTNEYLLLHTEFKHQKLRGEISSSYPDYYAGAYIDSDGELVVMLTTNDQQTTSLIAELTRNPQIRTEYASTSYSELCYYSDTIFNTMLELKTRTVINAGNKVIPSDLALLANDFIGCGIDEKENSVVVTLLNTNQQTINTFRKYITPFSKIVFEKADGVTQHEAIPSGQGYNVGGGTGSFGYHAVTYSTGTEIRGMVTAGHCTSYIGQNIINPSKSSSAPDRVYGTTLLRRYSGSVDASFIQLLNGYTASKTTIGGASIGSSWFTSVPQGKTVYMCGTTSAGYGYPTLTGTVKNTSYSFVTSAGVSLSDQLRIYYGGNTPRSGDSGGIVYAVSNGVNTVVGIHHGVLDIISGIDGRGIATKAQNIYNTLGVYPY